MEKQEVERVLRLQQHAYDLLIWIDRQEWLDEETVASLRFVDGCRTFLQKRNGMFTPALRVSDADNEEFVHLLCAFFTTSFRVENTTRSFRTRRPDEFITQTRPRLIAGSGRKSQANKEKTSQSARHLLLIALEELAIENDFDLSQTQLEALLNHAHTTEAATIWTYAHELLRRARFASQGAAVHQLWCELDKNKRESLNVEVVWAARQTLLNAMQDLTN